MPKLDKEEKELLNSYERGEWRPVKKSKVEFQRYKKYAQYTFLKDKRVNLRISTSDLDGIRKKALEEGIPYQTLISSIVYEYVSGRLVKKSTNR